MIKTALCDSFKLDILQGRHSPKDDYRIALYDASAKFDQKTEFYTSNGEVSGFGYKAGGKSLDDLRTGLNNGSAFMSFGDVIFENISVIASGCMIYNASKEGRAVAVFNFGKEVEARNGKLTVSIPSSVIAIV